MAAYEYDIFISYRRCRGEWIEWTKLFVQTLEAVLQPSMDRDLKIFWDPCIETGQSWPIRLGEALAQSRVFLPILYPNYFASDWCRLEMDLALRRHVDYSGPIFPITIDDGDCFPSKVQDLQTECFHQFYNPILIARSADHAALSSALVACKARLLRCIYTAPTMEATWLEQHKAEFRHMFDLRIAETPKLTKLPPLTGPDS